jgi:hypothetical protein
LDLSFNSLGSSFVQGVLELQLKLKFLRVKSCFRTLEEMKLLSRLNTEDDQLAIDVLEDSQIYPVEVVLYARSHFKPERCPPTVILSTNPVNP